MQPRAYFNGADLADLVASFERHGQVQAISVRPTGSGRYALIDGSCRLQAARELGWKTIRATVLDVSETDAAWMALEANEIRVDLHPFESARLYERMLEKGIVSSQREIADRLGKSAGLISQVLSSYRRTCPDIVEDQIKTWRRRGGKRRTPGLHIVREVARLDHKDQLELYQSLKSGSEVTAEEVGRIVAEILSKKNGNPAEEGGPTVNDTSDTMSQDDSEPANCERGKSCEPEVSHPGASVPDGDVKDIGDPTQADGDEPMSPDSDPGPEFPGEDAPAEAETPESRAAAQPQDDRGIMRWLDAGSLKVRCDDRELILAFDMHSAPSWQGPVRELLATLIQRYGVAEPSPGLSESGVSFNGRAAIVEDGRLRFSDADQEVMPLSAVLDVFLQVQG